MPFLSGVQWWMRKGSDLRVIYAALAQCFDYHSVLRWLIIPNAKGSLSQQVAEENQREPDE